MGLRSCNEAVRAGHPGLPAAPALWPSAEKQTLDATRQLLKTRTSTLVIAVLFTLLPFSFVFEGSRITFVLFRDAPVIALAWWATAAVMWAWHISIRRNHGRQVRDGERKHGDGQQAGQHETGRSAAEAPETEQVRDRQQDRRGRDGCERRNDERPHGGSRGRALALAPGRHAGILAR